MSSKVDLLRASLSASIRADLKPGAGESLSNRSEGMARVGRIIRVSKMSKEIMGVFGLGNGCEGFTEEG